MSAYDGEHTIFGLLGQASLTQNITRLGEIADAKANVVRFHLYEVLRVEKFIETEPRTVDGRGLGRGE
jgi:hypothetical protein